VIIRSREITLAFAAVALTSYAACTAEKASVEPVARPAVSAAQVDDVFASSDHLRPVYFDLSKSKLSDMSMELVKTNVAWLKSQPPFLVRLVGYADSRGSLGRNERLAERRALVLREAYAALGIPKERISIITRGAEAPACEPVTEDCLAKSRRCDTLIEEKSFAFR
jgi:outer membrane protein OmpA-like peptidoglycan-associated protein